MSLREKYEPRIRQALEDIKEALARKEVVCDTLTAIEVPDKIREIQLNKYTLTLTCSEFTSGTVTATLDGTIRTATVSEGKATLKLPKAGKWHVEHDLGDYVEVTIQDGTFDNSAELVKKKVVFSEGECSEEKITVHIDGVTGNNSKPNTIRVKKNGVVISATPQLSGSDINITGFEYEEGATYTVEYVLSDEVRGSIEIEISTAPDNQAGSADSFWKDVEGVTYSSMMGGFYSGLPAHIVFTDQKAPQEAKLTSWTANGKNGVVKWRDSGTDTLYISTQESGKKVILPEDCSWLFIGKEYNDFNGNSNTQTIDLANVNSSNVTNMAGMFGGVQNLTEIKNINALDTSKAVSFDRMFIQSNVIEKIDLSSFNTENVTTMEKMFYSNKALTELDVSSFDLKSASTTKLMFCYCDSLQTIYAKEWDVYEGSVTSYHMFDNSSKLPNYSSSNTDISMAKWKENGGYFTNPAKKLS